LSSESGVNVFEMFAWKPFSVPKPETKPEDWHYVGKSVPAVVFKKQQWIAPAGQKVLETFFQIKN